MAQDFYFPEGHSLDLGTPSIRFENNKKAILLTKELAASGRSATPEEQAALSKYVGWGDSRLASRVNELEKVLTEDELRLARGSSLNAHYTSLDVIRAMWGAVEQLGFGSSRPFRVLDPSAGIGHFKSTTPESLRGTIEWTEIELDKLTASILNALHPGSKIFAEGYEKVNLPGNYFDLAISNVPFGDYGVSSKQLPKSLTHPIHDFFLANTWQYLRPGGVMVYITSRFTMDKKTVRFREWLASRFDLLSATRLPETTFQENAGTKVVTDILILQKRETMNEDGKYASWVGTGTQTIGKYSVDVNRHYIEHAEMIVGIPAMDGHHYRSDGYTVHQAGMDIPSELSRIFSALPKLKFETPEAEKPKAVFSDDTVFTAPSDSPINAALMEIYSAAKKVIRAETRGATTGIYREHLNALYDAFVAKYGAINNKNNARHLKHGAEAPFLKSLEKYDPSTGFVDKSDIFSKTIVRSVALQSGQKSAADALLMCLDRSGKIDLAYIAISAGITEAEAIETLRGAIYLDPQKREWQTSEQYLSGNIREKLRHAHAAAQYDSKYQENVIALESSLPLTVQAKDIRAPLGAGWIPEDVVRDFIGHLLKEGVYEVSYIKPLAAWDVKAERIENVSPKLYKFQWGTNRANTLELLDYALNSRDIVIYDGYGEDRVVNQKETVAAQFKLAEIKSEFEKWLWSDPDRSQKLADLYNEEFNSVRVARFDGSHLSTPGLASSIKLRSNQRDAAWRIIQNQTTMIGHEVGMGKTLTAIVAAMESKRLGLVRKPLIVVPNHVMVGWQAVMQIAYPGANILIPGPDDLSKDRRPEFMSRIATNNWDMILVPFSSFKLLPVSTDAKQDFYLEQIVELEEFLEETKSANRHKTRTQKEIEKAIKRFEKKLKDLDLYEKDNEETITFDELGIDMLVVDEFHAYKNLYFNTRMTRIAGLNNTDSQRALDMFIKSRHLIKAGGKFVGMTGTPVTNTIAEMFTMQRYFQMETLRKLGLHQFDAWARQFALAEPGLEMTPDGSGFRMNTRFRKFVNVPELMQLWLQVADMRRVDPSEIERPELYNNKPVKAVSFAGQELVDFVKTLAERAEKVRSGRVRPEEDNMLMITGDGRKAAADLSLIVPAKPNAEMPKIDGVASLASLIRDVTNPLKGTQLIFCDLAVPKAKAVKNDEDDSESLDTADETRLTDNLYSEIRARLVKLGVAQDEIAFIHDAKNARQKDELFKSVNNGKIRVLIGSNEKMGTGLNVQQRLVAVHHVTPPWRPGDLEQQLGRMVRHGNLFPTVFQIVHVQSGSFDGYTWELLENKASFIAQVSTGNATDREVDDIGDTVLTFSEIKALASGNPKIMRKITLDAERQRMKSLRDSWTSSMFSMKSDLRFKQSGIDAERQIAAAFREAIRVRDESTTDEFAIELKEVFSGSTTLITKREEAGKRIKLLAQQAALKVSKGALSVEIGRYRGHVIYGTMDNQRMEKDPLPITYFEVYGKWLVFGGTDDVGITRSMDLALKAMDKKLAEMDEKISAWERDLTSYEVELAKPWEHEEKFKALEVELLELEKELSADGSGKKQDASSPLPKKLQPANSESEKEAAIKELEKMMDNPAAKSVADRLRGVASRETIEAVLALQSMMKDPETLARFDIVELFEPVGEKIPVTDKALEAIGAEIQRLQSLYEFGKTVQLSLFGDVAAVVPAASRRRR